MEQMESTELVADFVTTAGAMATETIGANTAPARRRALAPSDNSVDSKCNLLTSEIYLQKRKICEFCEFCMRKKYQSEKRIYFTQNPQNPQNYS
mgnify:CR=1 FL=1